MGLLPHSIIYLFMSSQPQAFGFPAQLLDFYLELFVFVHLALEKPYCDIGLFIHAFWGE